MINPLELTGKKILVAGVSSSIGEQIVNVLLGLGANVIMVDKDEQRLIFKA